MQSGQQTDAARSRGLRPSPRALAALVTAASVLLALVLALGWRPTASTPPAAGPAGPSSADALGPATSGSPPAAAASRTAYDADGVPRSLNGEPVLRGEAIVERASTGDASPFLVAGWHVPEAIPSCAPSAFHCGSTSLADSPWATDPGRRITLDQPAGTPYSFGWVGQWSGGFYVLRVRAACSLPGTVCLVVDAEIGPQGELPDQASGFDADGLPRTVDGQPVLRGPDVARQLATAGDTGPRYVAGRVEPAPSSKSSSCADLVTWDAHPCPAVRLADPDRGQPFDASAPTLEVALWAFQRAWDPAALWPGGYVVLRAEWHFIVGFVPPPGAHPAATQAPMPSITVSSAAYNARVVAAQGRHVHWGADIARLMARGTASSFLVTGVVRSQPCDACAGGATPVLREPPVRDVRDGGTAFPLLRADGTAFVVGKAMVWTEPRGVVVLEVRPYAGPCPPGLDCAEALEVLSVAATLP